MLFPSLLRRALTVVGLAGLTVSSSALAQVDDVAEAQKRAASNPKDPAAQLHLGRVLRYAGELDKARLVLGKTVLLASTRAEGLLPAVALELTRTDIERGDKGAANLTCKKLEDAGEKAYAAACRAEVHMMQNRATEALPEADRALVANADLYDGMIVKARVLAFQGKPKEALTLLDRAEQVDGKRFEAPFEKGLLHIRLGNPKVAVAPLREARKREPGHPAVAFHLGVALERGSDAQRAFADAVRIRPTYAEAHASLARVAVEQGDLTTADKAAQTAMKLAPSRYESVLALGSVRVAQGQWSEARKLGEQARQLVPSEAAGELLLADAHAGAGDLDLAIAAYQNAFSLDRRRPDALLRASIACRNKKRLTTARGFADRAVTEFPKSGPAWLELGEVTHAQSEPKEAKKALNKALSLGGVDKSRVQALLKKL